MQRPKKIYINIPDICVACGRPTRPGYQICDACMDFVAEEIPPRDYSMIVSDTENSKKYSKKRSLLCKKHLHF